MTDDSIDALQRADLDLHAAHDALGNLWVSLSRAGHATDAEAALGVKGTLTGAWRRVRSVITSEAPHAPLSGQNARTPYGRVDMDSAPAIADGLDLALLNSMEELAPDLAELAAHLRAARAVAERIDIARGRCLSEPVGGTRGTDLSDDVHQLLCTVEGQLLPAAGAIGLDG